MNTNGPQLAQMGILDLLLQSGPVAKLVLLILLFSSVFCWAVIIAKWRTLNRASEENGKFLGVFWNGKSIDEIFGKSEKFGRSPVAAVFKSGVKELRKLTGGESPRGMEEGAVDNISRTLARASLAEVSQLEKQVGWLATIASASPFVGLFGTVWGIMNSFQSIGATGSANLAVIAPGISEALVTTAAGIGAAIPAVVAYNYFAGQIRRMAVDMDGFSQDFLNIVQRSAMGGRKGGSGGGA